MSFAYTYDPQTSNLTSVRHITGTSPADSDRYTYYIYDQIGQLIRVNDQTDTTAGSTGTTWVYEYDFGGNMLARKRYPYQTGTLSGTPVVTSYAYTDSNWKDKVTSIGGQAIQYDAIGNVVNDGEWTYTWQAGRQLARMDKSGTTIEYKYDHNGMRVSRTVNGTETRYILNGSRIMHMTRGTDDMHFHYDGSGRVSMVDFGGEMFTYLHNLQGDIVGMLDAGGTLVVEYSYDAWGRPTAAAGSMAGTLGMLNPFRYRGYVWDEETGLYYLQSRYYRPEWGRFVSADNFTGKSGALTSHNLFAYCRSNPASMSDSSGYDAYAAVFEPNLECFASASLLDGALPFIDAIAFVIVGFKTLFDVYEYNNPVDPSIMPSPGYAPPAMLPAVTPNPNLDDSDAKYELGYAYSYGPNKGKKPKNPRPGTLYTLKKIVEFITDSDHGGLKGEIERALYGIQPDIVGIICKTKTDAINLAKAIGNGKWVPHNKNVIMKHIHAASELFDFIHIWFK